MYWLSPFTCGCFVSKYPVDRSPLLRHSDFIEAVVANGFGNQDIQCSLTEIVSITPPSAVTCQSYLENYMNMHGGYLLNPRDSSDCQFCPTSSSNAFLWVCCNPLCSVRSLTIWKIPERLSTCPSRIDGVMQGLWPHISYLTHVSLLCSSHFFYSSNSDRSSSYTSSIIFSSPEPAIPTALSWIEYAAWSPRRNKDWKRCTFHRVFHL